MTRIRLILLSLLAVFAFSAVASGSASAAGGPEWIVKGTKLIGTKKIKSYNLPGPLGVFTLTTKAVTIECKKEKNTGELIGGNPGTDKATITFEECSVAGKTVTECGATTAGSATGTIGPFKVKTLLGYPVGKKEKPEEAYDQFFPEPSETVFVAFELSGTNCALLNKQKVEVKATGTKAKVTGAPKCGVIAVLGKREGAEGFKITKSGEQSEEAGLWFPEKAKVITKEEVWNGTAFEEVTCGLEALKETAYEVGYAVVETEPKELFGWEV